MGTRITRKATSEIKFGYQAPVLELKEWFNLIPDNAKVTVRHYAGDNREPSETTITAEWPL